jgi:hypothetical protein
MAGWAGQTALLPLLARRLGGIRDTLKFEEDPAMGKKVSKSEKLDLILSELAKLRGEVKKLARDRAAVADQDVKPQPASSAGQSKKLPTRASAGKKPDKNMAPSKPVLVQAPQVPRTD